LKLGDVIATGTPTGAGARFDMARWSTAGDVVDFRFPASVPPESRGRRTMKNSNVPSRRSALPKKALPLSVPQSISAQGGIKSAIRPFANSMPMQLLRVREAVMQRFRPHLLDHGVTDQQWRIVRALAEAETLEIHEVSRRCCIHPASLSHMLPKLEAAGIIARRLHSADQRRVIVSLTPAGRRLFVRIGVESEKIYAQITRQIGSKRMGALYQLLDEALHSLSSGEETGMANGSAEARTKRRKYF
jgi:homoprotocatechuate degradation regulator HpaR